MSFFTKFSLKNRAAVIIMVFLVSVLGVYSGSKLPMEFLPSVDNPMVTVTTFGQGMDAETMTEKVTDPLEKEFRNLKYIDTILSSTSEGLSKIDIRYTSEADMKEATRDVEKIIGQIQFPQGVMKPYVAQLNTSMIPISQIAIQSEKGFTKQDEQMIEEEIIPQLEGVDGISNILFYGKSNTELAITLDPDRMNEKQISAQQVMMALQGKNVSVPAGVLTVDGKTNSLRVIGEFEDIEEIKNIPLTPQAKLKDIANVEIKQTYDAISRIGGKEGIVLVVSKEASENAVTIGKEIDQKVKELQEAYRDQFEIHTLYSTSEKVENAVYGMAKEVGIGALAATLIILLFLRNIKTTFIAVVSIPLSVLMTLYLLDISNVTLNILSLGGLAVAVGRLVDDSIVVIENIYRRIQSETFSKEVIIDATKEVGIAITSSTLTTIAVFLPIGFVSGGLGDFMLPMVLAVVYSILSSLLVAFTVVPLMSFWLLKKTKHKEAKPSKRYLSVLQWALSHKIIVLLVSFLLFVGSITAYVMLPKANVEADDESMVNIVMTFPADYDLKKAEEQAKDFEQMLLEQAKAKEVMFRMGAASEDARWGQATKDNEATFLVMFGKGVDIDGFIEKMKSHNDEYKPAEIEYLKSSLGSFGGGSTVELNVTAANEEDLVKTADLVKSELKEIDGLDKIKSNYEELQNEWVIKVDQEKAAQYGLTPQQVAEQMRMVVSSTPLGEITLNGENMMVMLDHKDHEFFSKNEMLDTMITSPLAGPIKLKEVANVNEEKIKTLVFHKDGKETIRVTAEIVSEDIKKVGTELNKMIANLNFPDDVRVEIAGATQSQQETFMDLFKIMGMAVVLVYLIMVITFGQARAPFAILFSLPLAVVGSILGLVVTRTPVDFNSLIGALMLIGIVVTNAIVLLECVLQNKQKGMITREALLEAGSTRLRPIIMTAVTTIVAMLPLALIEAEAGSMVTKSLAVVVIGGLTVSTLLTLVVVPVMYELLIGSGVKKQKKKDTFNENEAVL
jgi:hydrophobic/amphiphilic exporter-1 (mainly G- bacteria), HAE1 family